MRCLRERCINIEYHQEGVVIQFLDNYNFYMLINSEHKYQHKYQIEIRNVQMKIKFNCRMRVEYGDKPVTSDIETHINDQSVTNFGQKVTLTQQPNDNSFSLVICLITTKGNRYPAGTATLYYSQLQNMDQNQKRTFKLGKCLDPDATIQILIVQSLKQGEYTNQQFKTQRQLNKNVSSFSGRNNIRDMKFQTGNPLENLKKSRQTPDLKQTFGFQSQAKMSTSKYAPIKIAYEPSNPARSRSRNSRQNILEKSQISAMRQKSKSPLTKMETSRSKMRASNMKLSKYWIQEEQVGVENQAPSYEAYKKLQEKLKASALNTQKEFQKRLAVQDSESALKLQILKLKLKCEEDEKIVTEKCNQMKEMKLVYHKMQLELKQKEETIKRLMQNANCQQTINILEQEITKTHRQLDQIRQKNSRILKYQNEREYLLRKQLQGLKESVKAADQQRDAKIQENHRIMKELQNLKSVIDNKDRIIRNLQEEISYSLNQTIADKDKSIRILQSSKEQLQKNIDHLTRTIAVLETEKAKRSELQESSKNKISTVEYNYTLLMKTNNNLQQELSQIPKLKQKINSLLLSIKKLENEKRNLENNLENSKKNNGIAVKSLEDKIKADTSEKQRVIRSLQTQNISMKTQVKELQNKINYNLNNQMVSLRKNNDKLLVEVQNAKNLERHLNKQLRAAEIKLSSAVGELQALKSKFSGSQNMFKLQNERLYSQIKNLKEQLERQIVKSLGLKQKQQQTAGDNSLLSSKLAHLTEHMQKSRKDLEGKLQESGKRIKNLEEEIANQNAVNRQISEKERVYVNKIKEYNLNENEYVEILSKYENDINNLSSQNKVLTDRLKNKSNQLDNLANTHKGLASTLKQLEEKYKNLYEQNKEFNSKVNSLQKQKVQLQYEYRTLKDSFTNRENQIQKLKNQNQEESKAKSNFKDDLLKLQNKAESIKKEHALFKEHLTEVLMREFGSIDGLDINLYIVENQRKAGSRIIKDDFNDDDFETGMTTKRTFASSSQMKMAGQGPSQNDIISAITNFSKETKAVINTLKDQIKVASKDLEDLRSELYQTNFQLNQKIKEKTQKIYEQQKKEEELLNYLDSTKKDLLMSNQILSDELTAVKQDLKATLEKNDQLIFNINGLEMSKQADRDYYDRTIKQNKEFIYNLQSNYANVFEKNTALELEKNQIGLELRFSNEEINKLKIEVAKKQEKIQGLNSEISMKQALINEIKAKNKELIHRVSQIQLFLAAQKQANQTNKKALSEQEKKLMETKDFLNGLIKQKEVILKEEINLKQKCIELEAQNSQLLHRIENIELLNQKLSKQLQIEKQNHKKTNTAHKNAETELQALLQKHRRANQKIKQKQRQLTLRTQTFRATENSLENEIEHKNREIKQKNEELELLRKFQQQERVAMEKEMGKTQDQLFKNKEELKYGLYALQNANKQLTKSNKVIQEKLTQITVLKESFRSLEAEKKSIEEIYNGLLQELREKDERMYEMASEMNALENIYHQKLVSAKRELENLEENMNCRYEAMCEDYEVRIEELEKERDYLNGKIEIIEGECRKIEEKLQLLEYEDNELRMRSQDRLIKSQEQKNQMISNLRVQIKKICEEKSMLQEKNLKISIEVQSLKNTNRNLESASSRLQSKTKELEEKIRHLKEEVAENQHQIRQKSLQIKQFEQTISNYQWSLERELKKELQSMSKNVIGCFNEKQDRERALVVEQIHEVETKISKLINSKVNGSSVK